LISLFLTVNSFSFASASDLFFSVLAVASFKLVNTSFNFTNNFAAFSSSSPTVFFKAAIFLEESAKT